MLTLSCHARHVTCNMHVGLCFLDSWKLCIARWKNEIWALLNFHPLALSCLFTLWGSRLVSSWNLDLHDHLWLLSSTTVCAMKFWNRDLVIGIFLSFYWLQMTWEYTITLKYDNISHLWSKNSHFGPLELWFEVLQWVSVLIGWLLGLNWPHPGVQGKH